MPRIKKPKLASFGTISFPVGFFLSEIRYVKPDFDCPQDWYEITGDEVAEARAFLADGKQACAAAAAKSVGVGCPPPETDTYWAKIARNFAPWLSDPPWASQERTMLVRIKVT